MNVRPYIWSAACWSCAWHSNRILGKPVFADAEGEHRGERLIEIELSRVDLTEMEKQLHLHAS